MAGVDAVMMRRHPVSVQPRARASVQLVRPSPFHHVTPEIQVTQTLPVHAVAARASVATPESVASADSPKESGLSRFLGRIPLLRHFRKHPPSDEAEPR